MSRSRTIRLVLLLAVSVSAVAAEEGQQDVPSETEKVTKPTPDGTVEKLKEFSADDIEQGRHNLNAICSRCHGKDGRGGKGPDLTDGLFRHVQTDRDIINVIGNGIAGTGMPGFGVAYEDFFLPVVAYLRSEAAQTKKKRLGRLAMLHGEKSSLLTTTAQLVIGSTVAVVAWVPTSPTCLRRQTTFASPCATLIRRSTERTKR